MTKPELARRMLTTPYDTFLKAVRLVREGNGNLTLQCDVTMKQCSAAHEWVKRYNRINPQASQCAPSSEPPPRYVTDGGTEHGYLITSWKP